jgi:ferredoxin-NADP reductase
MRRLESASIGQFTFSPLNVPNMSMENSNYRQFELNNEDTETLLTILSSLQPQESLELKLQLSDGQKVWVKLPTGRFFSTRKKMLEVCMGEDASH